MKEFGIKIKNITSKTNLSAGFSVLEVMLASALFIIFSTATITVVIQGFNANRLGSEMTVATQYATEGLEAVKAIKNQNYSLLIDNSSTGVRRSNPGNYWEFFGTSNSFDKYGRSIKVESVNRDVSGNIVSSGGTPDPDTKKVTSTVTWNFTAAKPETVSLVTYLSDWRKPISVGQDGGILVYGEGTVTTPRFRTYSNVNNNYTNETNGQAGLNGRNFIVRTSPTKQEAVLGYVNSSGTLQVSCYNGTSWSNEWSVTVGGNASTRRFDIAYETNTGDTLILYSKNATTNELGYRTKLGSSSCGSSNWSTETTFDSPGTSQAVYWVKASWDRRSSSNLLAFLWADGANDLQAAIWNGNAWVQRAAALETSMEVVGTSTTPNVDNFDIEFESLSGDIMAIWANSAGGNGTNGIRYATCPGGVANCTWSGVTTPPTWSDDAHNLDISSNPDTDQIIFASVGDGGDDLQVGYWNGSAWTNVANADTACQTSLAGAHLLDTGWLISGGTTRAVVVYNDANTTTVNYRHYNPANNSWTPSAGSAPINFTSSPALGNPRRWYDIQNDPNNKDRFLLTVADVNSDLFSKRLVIDSVPNFTWTNTEGGAALEATLSQAIASPFSFAYWRNP